MYEDLSYDIILQRMLDNIPENIDKREGSVIYDALAPAAMEIMSIYIELSRLLQESFANTASREYLEYRALERGLVPESATNAILIAEFVGGDVAIGDRFTSNGLYYVVTENLSNTTSKVMCEQSGTSGNGNLSTIYPVDYIENLQSATLTSIFTFGEDEESTEDFRERYLASFYSQPFGGNCADYMDKVNSLSGVGGCKIIPAWQGGGTVKIIIISDLYREPSDETVSFVQETIDPQDESGNGYGIAPIGHKVTVVASQELQIDVTAEFTFVNGYTFDFVLPDINSTISEYFQGLCENWQDSEYIIVRPSQIETRLLSIEGIYNAENVYINSSSENLYLDYDQIPFLGDVTNAD